MITAPADQVKRQLAAQYPAEETLARVSIMTYFDDETNEKINQMWIHIRCYSIYDIPVWAWALGVIAVAAIVISFARRRVHEKQNKIEKISFGKAGEFH